MILVYFLLLVLSWCIFLLSMSGQYLPHKNYLEYHQNKKLPKEEKKKIIIVASSSTQKIEYFKIISGVVLCNVNWFPCLKLILTQYFFFLFWLNKVDYLFIFDRITQTQDLIKNTTTIATATTYQHVKKPNFKENNHFLMNNNQLMAKRQRQQSQLINHCSVDTQ